MFSSGLNCNLSFPSCLGYPQDSEELIPKMACEPIILNVYDMDSVKISDTSDKRSIKKYGSKLDSTAVHLDPGAPRKNLFVSISLYCHTFKD
ncbi:hypothetical protein P5V15_014347 [Pogonomyrmex californicus]